MKNEPTVHPDSVSCLETRNNITLIVLAIISNNCEKARGALIIFTRTFIAKREICAIQGQRDNGENTRDFAPPQTYLDRKVSCSCCDEIGPIRLENVADETLPVGPSTLYRCERYNSRKSQTCPAKRIIFLQNAIKT